jgi:hypothetical protein
LWRGWGRWGFFFCQGWRGDEPHEVLLAHALAEQGHELLDLVSDIFWFLFELFRDITVIKSHVLFCGTWLSFHVSEYSCGRVKDSDAGVEWSAQGRGELGHKRVGHVQDVELHYQRVSNDFLQLALALRET